MPSKVVPAKKGALSVEEAADAFLQVSQVAAARFAPLLKALERF